MSNDLRGSFRTHANYLRAFACLCGYETRATKRAVVTPRLLARVRASLPQGAATPLPAKLHEVVRKSLMNAWGTELILALSGTYATEEELLRLVNNWGVVQAYYALYHATQALSLARGNERPDSHQKTQRVFLDWWRTRSVEPLSLSVGADGCRNGMTVVAVDSQHAWARCTAETAWSLAGLALRTTREDALRDALRKRRDDKQRAARKAWREDEAQRRAAGRRARREPKFPLPHLSAAEKDAVFRQLRSYSVMDYLYRLRIRANYEDARMFTEGPDDDVTSRQVHLDLRRVVDTALFATELHVRARVGQSVFATWVTDWIGTKMPPDVTLGVAGRRMFLTQPTS